MKQHPSLLEYIYYMLHFLFDCVSSIKDSETKQGERVRMSIKVDNEIYS